jgi:hypothetical protein
MKETSPYPVIRSIDFLTVNPQVITGIGKQFNVGRGKVSLSKRQSGLSFPSELTVAGCSILCLKALETNSNTKLFFSGNGAALFPDAAVMFVKNNFPAIPAQNIMVPDRNSATTQDSIRNVPTILNQHGYTKTVLGTIDRHINRTAYQFSQSRSDVISSMASTDLIVAESSTQNHDTIEAWHSSTLTKLDELAEELFFYFDRGKFGRLGEAAVRAHRPN